MKKSFSEKTIHFAFLAYRFLIKLYLKTLILIICICGFNVLNAQRIEISLNGKWAVGESVEENVIPKAFNHTAPVPGLTHQAVPAFPDVDQYETKDFIRTMINAGIYPRSEAIESWGRTRQKRNYFWYKKSFTAPSQKELATLVVNKAQFSTSVWLNGEKIGDHLGCFTAGRFDLTKNIKWGKENELIIRIGAHPGVMPKWASFGSDGEKQFWTPGIYDDVSLIFADLPAIEWVQVAPRIDSSKIVVQTQLKNTGAARTATVSYKVKTWKQNKPVGKEVSFKVQLKAGETKTITHEINIPDVILWSPDNPFLYLLETSTDGDNNTTRFGMREFHFDSSTGRAYLNGEIFFMRGASITLHRFFTDSLSGGLPWDETWVRKLLVDIPKKMNLNSFRICIGPAPQKWLDIADEAGLILQWEYFLWSDRDPFYHEHYNKSELISEFKDFVRDSWNHPSVAIWNASNETRWDFLGDTLIPEVRKIDLSNRPWGNGRYNLPQDINDPQEIHPYPYLGYYFNRRNPEWHFKLTDFENTIRFFDVENMRTAHANIINEYGWLWLHRDGSPTVLTAPVYEELGLMTPETTPEKRFEQYAYRLAGITEYYRAFRNYAAVMYLAYLDGDVPNCYTMDNFKDVQKLELEPHFADYVGEAFKPLGVYINFWQPELKVDTVRNIYVMLVNDEKIQADGRLELVWVNENHQSTTMETKTFTVGANGQMTYKLNLKAPSTPGKYTLMAKAYWDKQPWSPVISRRQIEIIPKD